MPHLVGGAGVERLRLAGAVLVIELRAVAGVELRQVERLQAAELLPLAVHLVELLRSIAAGAVPELLGLAGAVLVIEPQAVASGGPCQAAELLPHLVGGAGVEPLAWCVLGW